MNLREIEDAGLRHYEAKGRMNGEQADHDGCPECYGDGCVECCATDVDLDEHEAQCHHCLGAEGFVDPKCDRCGGTGRIDAPDHPDWCSRCGMTGRCLDCDPDRARDEAMDR